MKRCLEYAPVYIRSQRRSGRRVPNLPWDTRCFRMTVSQTGLWGSYTKTTCIWRQASYWGTRPPPNSHAHKREHPVFFPLSDYLSPSLTRSLLFGLSSSIFFCAALPWSTGVVQVISRCYQGGTPYIAARSISVILSRILTVGSGRWSPSFGAILGMTSCCTTERFINDSKTLWTLSFLFVQRVQNSG